MVRRTTLSVTALAPALTALMVAWGNPACAQVDHAEAPRELSAVGDGTLESYIELAGRESPAIEAARARLEAARAMELRVGGLPDPVISYGHYFEEVETRVGPQVYRVGVRQRLPWFGKLSLAEDAARERSYAREEMLRAARLDVAASVTSAFADYAHLARAIEITEERLSLLRALDEVVRSSYSSGRALYGDVMKAQIGLARVEDSLASLLARRLSLSSRLAAAAGIETGGPLPFPELIPEVTASESTGEPSAGRTTASMEESPDLLALTHEVEASRYERRLASRAFLPDLTVGLDYIATDESLMPVEDSGKDPLIGVASLSVPLWFGKHRGAVQQAESTLRASEKMLEQRRLELEAEAAAAQFELEDALRRVELYEGRLVPAARQSVSAADAAYRAGAADFDALVAAHETALELELGLERARADALIAAARLARVTGVGGQNTDRRH